MALPDLSGSKIQDTYQRVIHTDGSSLFDGAGNTILASTELSSLQTMNNNTISNADWGFVESMNQNVSTTASVTFTSITASNNIVSNADIFCGSLYAEGTTMYIGGTPINKVLVDNLKRGFASDSDSVSDGGYASDVARIEKINADVITSTAFIGPLTGLASTATLATTATNITTTANNLNNETTYITFVDGTTGTQGIETDAGLQYNPYYGELRTLNLSATNITASGWISASGDIYFDTITGGTF